ncbi:MAG: SDR family NAD(P)-dependent oxidoreductase [Bacteroidetes bacterium]|nr:SDR family NAD(P)-dependent oxidoreductase [Bacteroidota bacterium]
MKSFKDKIVVITGGASGMGRSLAVQLAAEGATVLISDINESGLAGTRDLIGAGRCQIYKVDVGNRHEVYAFAKEVLDKYGYIDVLINNAGIAIGEARLMEIPLEDFERLININLWGVIHHTRAFLDVILTRPEAAIANTSSVFGLMGIPTQIPYCVSKFAVRGFSDSLRLELSDTNVAVTCIHPGGIDTNIVANGIHYNGKKEVTVEKFKELVMTSSDRAATIILNAIRRKAKRVMVGPDARVIRMMTQLAPGIVDREILRRRSNLSL